MHFLGLKWDNINGESYIQFAQTPNSEKGELFKLKIGSYINISFIDDKKYCTGYFKHPDYTRVSCGRIVSQGAQCDECWQKNRGVFLPLKTLNDSQKKMLEERNHFNYINLFGSGLVKTGVVAAVRKYTRVWEQGAHSSLFFTECNGVIAREIEQWISNSFEDIKERVATSTKVNLIYEYSTKDESQDLLMSVHSSIMEKIPDCYRKYLKEPEYLYNIEKYYLNDKISSGYFIKNLSSVKNISGKIISVIGEIVVLEDARGRRLFFNTKLLLGRLVDIRNNSSDFIISENSLKPLSFRITKQVSMF